jgi:hypothetical protein
MHKDSILKPTKHCSKKGQGGKGGMELNASVNLLKVFCTHLWNYHSETLLYC